MSNPDRPSRGNVDHFGNRIRPSPFQKGKSGNPGGRTKAEMAVRRLQHELIAAETDGGREIIGFVLEVFRGQHVTCADAKSLRWAADFLADRLWGKAPLTVMVKPAGRVDVEDMRKMSLEELQRIAAGGDTVIDAESREPIESPPGDVH